MPDDSSSIQQIPRSKNLHLDRRAGRLAQQLEGRPDELLDDRQLAQLLSVSEQWPQAARSGGYGPPFITLGPKFVRYRLDAVVAWLKDREAVSIAHARLLMPRRAPIKAAE